MASFLQVSRLKFYMQFSYPLTERRGRIFNTSFLSCIRDFLGSNLGYESSYPYRVFGGFHQSLKDTTASLNVVKFINHTIIHDT